MAMSKLNFIITFSIKLIIKVILWTCIPSAPKILRNLQQATYANIRLL